MGPFPHPDNNFKVMIESILGKNYNLNVFSYKGIYKKSCWILGPAILLKSSMLGGEGQ